MGSRKSASCYMSESSHSCQQLMETLNAAGATAAPVTTLRDSCSFEWEIIDNGVIFFSLIVGSPYDYSHQANPNDSCELLQTGSKRHKETQVPDAAL